jgi:hypothetical protein
VDEYLIGISPANFQRAIGASAIENDNVLAEAMDALQAKLNVRLLVIDENDGG